MTTNEDQFGVPLENILAAKKAVQKYRNQNLSSHVPSKREILELDKESLSKLLIAWTCHSPIEIIPSILQITEVKALLEQRPDKSEITSLINMCKNYIHSE